MTLLGSAGIGVVLGWVSVLVGRRTSGTLGVSWRALAFACVALIGAAALAFAYAGAQSAFAASLAFFASLFAAAVVLGTKTARHLATSSREE